jgi:radical SAM superfamily enzyme YgiQ (UPF0313 family)
VVDDNFTLNTKRAEEICDLLVSEKIGLPWQSQNGIRADRVTEDLAKKMKRSGCRYVWVGVETADEEVFEKTNKGEELEDIKAGIQNLKSVGIRVGGFFIVGLPNSTRQSDMKAIDFVKELGIDGWWFNFIPYPHTLAWDWVRSHGKLLRPCEGALQYGSHDIDPVFETEEYSRESRVKTYNEIHVRLRYFDRLADLSLKQTARWQKVFKTVRPFGLMATLSLAVFIMKYNTILTIKTLFPFVWRRK